MTDESHAFACGDNERYKVAFSLEIPGQCRVTDTIETQHRCDLDFTKPLKMSLAKLLPLIFLILDLARLSSAVIFRDPSTINRTYDYIVAGGGLTGLVVANRLTEDPNSKYC